MTVPAPILPLTSIPPLNHGDRLTRDDFERRFDATPNRKRAELIEGVVRLPPPFRSVRLGTACADVIGWLGYYRAYTPGVHIAASSHIRLDLDNEPQPDALMIVEPSCGGQARIDNEGYIQGAPELVAEIAASSAGIDLTDKLRVYARNNVREYLVWRVEEQAFDWFVLRQGQYQPLQRTATGLLQSEQFPGLWLDPDALLRFDVAGVLRVVQQGIASAEHAAFVAQLQARVTQQS